MRQHILIVEDEPSIRDMIRLALELAGFSVAEAEHAVAAERLLADQIPDLILLDWMLPGMSGIDFAKKLKNTLLTKDIPIIMLTARAEEDNKVKGLETGADDYVTKPFSPRELIARIKTVLRRGNLMTTQGEIKTAHVVLNTNNQQVLVNARPINLTPLEYRLLHFFLLHPDRVYSRDQLLTYVWGGDAYVDERTVDVQIRRLRRALNQHGRLNLIQTVRGTGYKFLDPS